MDTGTIGITKMMYLSEAKKRLDELQTIYPANVAPCREGEVLALERRVGRALPGAYKEFLLWMGHGSTGVFRGTDCFYYDLPVIGPGAIELLQEDAFPEPLPADAFVFLMHQGYQFAFFRLSEGEDPPVSYYYEGAKGGLLFPVTAHFSEFLLLEIETYAKLIGAAYNPQRANRLDDLLSQAKGHPAGPIIGRLTHPPPESNT